MSGRKSTWANSLEVPTFERLDRILMSTEWEKKYPMATVMALSREISDHTPLLLNSGAKTHHISQPRFCFELGWLLQKGFYKIVEDVWNKRVKGLNAMEVWQNKIRRLRQFLRGWAKNISGRNKKEKMELIRKTDDLDKKAESTFLSQQEIELKHKMKDRLVSLLREEEIYWYQRSKSTKLLQGDRNTKYFHLIANGKHRKTRIFQLEQDGEIIKGDDKLKKYITRYYKSLFGLPDGNNFSMDESQTEDIPQISLEENTILSSQFSEKEVRDAIFQMTNNKAPGPDGFPAEFYQEFWGLIKRDLLAMLEEFHKGELPICNLNFGTITLLPKAKEVKQIQQYRPICLLNVSFKIFTKVIANKTAVVASKIVRPSQTAFMSGRNILEGVVILHETLHEIKKKKLNGVVLKLDFEKAYDKVNCDFLQQTLKMKGFSRRWCEWIKNVVSKGNVNVKVNDDLGHYFQTKKGVRQGDSLSPFLFNLVADMLTILIARAKANGQFRGVIPHLVEGGLSILQYADDTILFLEHDLDEAVNLKLVLSVFEQLSGLKINFHKSEVFLFGEAKSCKKEYVQLFGCKEGEFPFKYLGIPMHHRKIQNKDWIELEERFQKKLCSWKGKHLSVGGRLVLINSVLSSLPMFMFSFFEAPKGVIKRLDYYRSRFFWQSDEHKKKYRLTKWTSLCRPKCFGGLGILDLEIQNKCLLSKWLFKLLNEDGAWQSLIKKKYLQRKSITQVSKRPGDSFLVRADECERTISFFWVV